MTHLDLISELTKYIPKELAEDIVNQFITIKTDVSTGLLGRSAPGKFVETIVQILQYIAEGSYVKSFKAGDIEDYLKNTESRTVNLPDDLKINVTRICRGMYAVRSKRSIIHKGGINPNIYDLSYLYSAAQWVLSEIVRNVLSTDMNTASQLIEYIQVPFSPLVEDFSSFSGRRLVLATCTAREEVLILLHSYFPNIISRSELYGDMNRRNRTTIANALTLLFRNKQIEGNPTLGYKLTTKGYVSANEIIRKLNLKNKFNSI